MTKNVVMEVRERKYRRNLWGTKPEKQMLINLDLWKSVMFF